MPALALIILQAPSQSAGESVAEPRSKPVLSLLQSSGTGSTCISQAPRRDNPDGNRDSDLGAGTTISPLTTSSSNFSVTLRLHHLTVSLMGRSSDFGDNAFSLGWNLRSQGIEAMFGIIWMAIF